MICIHIYFSDGDEIFTRWNGTEQEAIDYYACSVNNGFATTELYFPHTGRRYTYKRNAPAGLPSCKAL